MDLVIEVLQSGLSGILPFIILLGLLIFVHELGHFLVAKYFGVRVEVFSLGFGKKLLQFKRGDTNYCISLIPLGGYVKMYGDEVGASIPDSEKKYAFTLKPVSQRFAVVLAGPLMNFFFAIFLFFLIALIGEQAISPSAGDIDNTSIAFQSGFRSGDKIISINEQTVSTWDEVNSFISSHLNKTLKFKIERSGSHSIDTISVEPSEGPNSNILSTEEKIGTIFGLNYLSRASIIGVSNPQSPAGKAGFKTGDLIISINDEPIKYLREVESKLKPDVPQWEFSVNRWDEEQKKQETLKFQISNSGFNPPLLETIGFDSFELFLGAVINDLPAAQAGLKKYDRILKINNQSFATWDELVGLIKNYKAGLPPLEIKFIRDGEEKTTHVTPKLNKIMNAHGFEEDRFMIGIAEPNFRASPDTLIHRESNFFTAIKKGISEGMKWTHMTVMSFVRLFQNKVSAKSIGGVLTIGQMASQTFKLGISPFLKIMAIISINLFILNLLPVPVLDGGYLVFYSIEVLRGTPLSMRKLEIAQQVGLILLLGLILFSLFNDVTRFFNISW